jgi:hypothetical protein
MDQTVRFQETLRRLAMIDEGFVEEEVGLDMGPAATSALDPKTAALLRVGAPSHRGRRAVGKAWPSRVSCSGGGGAVFITFFAR